jgi:hypothetical protein
MKKAVIVAEFQSKLPRDPLGWRNDVAKPMQHQTSSNILMSNMI